MRPGTNVIGGSRRPHGITSPSGSLGILVGGLGTMVPERHREITALGLHSTLSGTIGACMSGAIAGILA